MDGHGGGLEGWGSVGQAEQVRVRRRALLGEVDRLEVVGPQVGDPCRQGGGSQPAARDVHDEMVVATSQAAGSSGLGTVEGPLIGAAVYVLLQRYLGASGAIHLIVLGAVSVVVILAAPRGIAGFARDRFGWTLFPIERKPPAT